MLHLAACPGTKRHEMEAFPQDSSCPLATAAKPSSTRLRPGVCALAAHPPCSGFPPPTPWKLPPQGKPVIKDMQASVDPFCVTATFTIHNKPVNAFWALFEVGSLAVACPLQATCTDCCCAV